MFQTAFQQWPGLRAFRASDGAARPEYAARRRFNRGRQLYTGESNNHGYLHPITDGPDLIPISDCQRPSRFGDINGICNRSEFLENCWNLQINISVNR